MNSYYPYPEYTSSRVTPVYLCSVRGIMLDINSTYRPRLPLQCPRPVHDQYHFLLARARYCVTEEDQNYKEYVTADGGTVNFECPVCGSDKAVVTQRLLQIPYYDDFHAIILLCPDCGLRRADFANLSSKGPAHYSYTVETEEDFTTKVVRSIEGVFRVPEIGVEIKPATAPSSWIRNVEGILLDIKEKVEIARDHAETEQDRLKAEDLIKRIDGLLAGKEPFTLDIRDDTGNSVIIPADPKKLRIEYYEVLEN